MAKKNHKNLLKREALEQKNGNGERGEKRKLMFPRRITRFLVLVCPVTIITKETLSSCCGV